MSSDGREATTGPRKVEQMSKAKRESSAPDVEVEQAPSFEASLVAL